MNLTMRYGIHCFEKPDHTEIFHASGGMPMKKMIFTALILLVFSASWAQSSPSAPDTVPEQTVQKESKGGKFKGVLANAVEAIKQITATSIEKVNKTADVAAEKLKETAGKAKETADVAVENVKKTAEAAVEKTKEAAKEAKEAAGKAKEAAVEASEAVKKMGKDALEKVTEKTREATAAAKEAANFAGKIMKIMITLLILLGITVLFLVLSIWFKFLLIPIKILKDLFGGKASQNAPHDAQPDAINGFKEEIKALRAKNQELIAQLKALEKVIKETNCQLVEQRRYGGTET